MNCIPRDERIYKPWPCLLSKTSTEKAAWDLFLTNPMTPGNSTNVEHQHTPIAKKNPSCKQRWSRVIDELYEILQNLHAKAFVWENLINIYSGKHDKAVPW